MYRLGPGKVWRAIKRQRPVKTLKEGTLVAFPWEIGLVRFLWLTRFGARPVREWENPSSETQEADYSRSFMRAYGPDRRVRLTMFLLTSIPDCPHDSLLVIGPRYEPEILMARGLGWEATSVRGLDTFSYSPLIDVGDMHQLPYKDESYGAVTCAWTLSYSTAPQRAAKEMMRVVRRGGYLIVSMHKVPVDYEGSLSNVLKGDERIQTLSQLDALFQGLVRVAGFEQDLARGEEGQTIAAYKKP